MKREAVGSKEKQDIYPDTKISPNNRAFANRLSREARCKRRAGGFILASVYDPECTIHQERAC